MFTHKLVCLFAVAAALSACGGDDGGAPVPAPTPSPAPAPSPAPSPSPSPAPAPSSPPGGLYVGYYQEDPTTNPEDPTPGAFSLNLPQSNAVFSGSMYFSYVGCQSSNVGNVTGTKNDLNLAGTWSGTVDGLAESGGYIGLYDPATLSYAGTYSNAGGKQFRDLRPCTQYWIAPNGTWEMFPVDANVPSGFVVSATGTSIAWSAVPNATYTLVYLLDPAIAQSTGNPVLWQTVVGKETTVTWPSSLTLQSGKQYVVAVGISNGQSQRQAFGSQRFVAP